MRLFPRVKNKNYADAYCLLICIGIFCCSKGDYLVGNEIKEHLHSMHLFGRERLEVEGVTYVESFDNTGLSLSTVMGDISVEGRDLKIEGFCKEKGTVIIQGIVNGIFYSEETKGRKKLFERLFQ